MENERIHGFAVPSFLCARIVGRSLYSFARVRGKEGKVEIRNESQKIGYHPAMQRNSRKGVAKGSVTIHPIFSAIPRSFV